MVSLGIDVANANHTLQLFDKVTVLYEGRQIYFGRIHDAKKFFIDMGFECPDRQTTADFLTVSLSNIILTINTKAASSL